VLFHYAFCNYDYTYIIIDIIIIVVITTLSLESVLRLRILSTLKFIGHNLKFRSFALFSLCSLIKELVDTSMLYLLVRIL